MISLAKEQILRMHGMIIESSGGDAGIRDEAMLESAISSAYQTFDGQDLYPTPHEKIARLAFGLVNNHPFVDGNKRIGTFVMLMLFELNNINIIFSDDEVIHIGMSLAEGKMKYAELLDAIFSKILWQAESGIWLSEKMEVYGARP
jgi:death-on-curing protein